MSDYGWRDNARSLIIAAVVVLILFISIVYYYSSQNVGETISTTSPTQSISTATVQSQTQTNPITSTTHSSNTFLTSCSITGEGTLYLRVISDSTGAPVQGAKVSAVLQAVCIVGSIGDVRYSETQKLYIDNFTQTGGGWLLPVLPSGATSFGTFNFTVQYSSKTYIFQANISPVSVTCVTLHVPSGTFASIGRQFSSGDCEGVIQAGNPVQTVTVTTTVNAPQEVTTTTKYSTTTTVTLVTTTTVKSGSPTRTTTVTTTETKYGSTQTVTENSTTTVTTISTATETVP